MKITSVYHWIIILDFGMSYRSVHTSPLVDQDSNKDIQGNKTIVPVTWSMNMYYMQAS